MTILNYTTSIDAQKTAVEIQSMLARAKASAVMSEYDTEGVISHIAFRLNTQQGNISFRLPGNVDGVLAAMHVAKRKNKNARITCTREQAARVGWRIIKDWVEAQLAIIEAGMATTDQVFLPYAQTLNGQTVYERFAGGDRLLQLTHGKA